MFSATLDAPCLFWWETSTSWKGAGERKEEMGEEAPQVILDAYATEDAIHSRISYLVLVS
jgi:hypothetical protein